MILYTSGTTAHPKGCMLSHRASCSTRAASPSASQIPPATAGGIRCRCSTRARCMLMTACFVAGATFISMPRFERRRGVRPDRDRARQRALPALSDDHADADAPPALRSSWTASARAVDRQRRARPTCSAQIQEAYAPAMLMSAYGITELCGTRRLHRARRSARGAPWDLRAPAPRVRDARRRPGDGRAAAAPASAASSSAAGRSRFAGYFRNAEATRAAIDAEGYFHTGDLCSIDDDGRISFHGRLKDMLKVGGENVAAIEVESFLATHPAIKLAQVVGDSRRAADRGAGRVRRARSRRDAHRGRGDRLLQGRRSPASRCRATCASSTEWPMSATKIQKFRLRDRLIEELEL